MVKPATFRMAAELIGHEADVLECYRDVVNVWTWAVGITNYSPHKVYPRYKDNPQTIAYTLTIYLWVLDSYLKRVDAAFHPIKLKPHQRAAAASFDYNTGSIHKASWVKHFKAGRIAQARKAFMYYRKPASIIGRRKRERDLFFDAKWTDPKKMLLYKVAKPSYRPRAPKSVPFHNELKLAMKRHYGGVTEGGGVPNGGGAGKDATDTLKGNGNMSIWATLGVTALKLLLPEGKDKGLLSGVRGFFASVFGGGAVASTGEVDVGLTGVLGKAISMITQGGFDQAGGLFAQMGQWGIWGTVASVLLFMITKEHWNVTRVEQEVDRAEAEAAEAAEGLEHVDRK